MKFQKSFAHFYHHVSKNVQNVQVNKQKKFNVEEKNYPTSHELILPTIKKIKVDYNTIFNNRKSTRIFSSQKIVLEELSTLLYFANGMLDQSGRRTYPSGGALYPLELYIIGTSTSIDKLTNKVLHYCSKKHCLENLKSISDHDLASLFIPASQKIVSTAQLLLVITSFFDRSYQKYNERSYRYSLLEAGHMSQNICLTSSALEIGCCPIGGYLDDKMNKALQLDKNKEATLLVVALGGK